MSTEQLRSGGRHEEAPLSLDVFESLSATWSACICNSDIWTAVRHDVSNSLTMAKFDGAHEKRWSHDGLYAARVYRHDH